MQELRKSILVEVVAGILVLIFAQTIGRFAWNGIVWSSINIYAGIAKSVYKNAALGQRNWIDIVLLTFLLYFMVATVLGLYLRKVEIRGASRIKEAYAKLPKKIRSAIPIIMVVAFVLSVLYVGTLAFVDLQLNASFQQRLTVLAPKISEQEYKELQAAWASMQSRPDYESINTRMDSLARQHGIELPELLLK